MKSESTWLLLLVAIAAVLCAPAIGKKAEAKKVDGAALFAQHCNKCHAGGGNLVKSSHPIVGSKQLSSLVMFKTYLSAPPGHMPYYQDLVNNKKKLESLYDYCKSLKDTPQKEACLSTVEF